MYQRHQIADLADGQLPRKLDRNGRGASHAKLCMQALYASRSSRGTKAYRGKGCGDGKTFLLVFSVCNAWADKHMMAFQHPRTRGPVKYSEDQVGLVCLCDSACGNY